MATYEFAGAYDAAVLDSNSQLLKNTAFELVTEPGGVLATLYTNRTRSATVAQPFLSDAEGNVHLFTDPGRYRLRQAASPPGEEITVQPDPDETEGELEAHVIAADPHPVYLTAAEGNAAYAPVGEPVAAAHIVDPTDAHDASAVSFVPTGTIAATDVQAAIAEVAAEIDAVFVPVTRYGAVGDGVNDDTAEINAALAAEPMVFFPPGNWKISGDLLPTSNQHILLAPGARVFVAPGVTNVRCFNLNTVSDVIIEGGELDGTKGVDPTGNRFGVMVQGLCERIVLDRIYSHDFPGTDLAGTSSGDGFYVGGSGVNVPTNVTLRGCISERNVRQGLSITGGKGIFVKGGSYSFTSGTNLGCGIVIEPGAVADVCVGIFIDGVLFDSNAGTFAVAASRALGVPTEQRGLSVTGCLFRGQRGVFAPRWEDVTFTGNIAEAGPLGASVELVFSNSLVSAVFADNVMDASGEDVYGFHISDSTDVIVKDNLVKNTGRQGFFCDQRVAAGAVSNMEGLLIDGNTFVDCNTGAGGSVLLFREQAGAAQTINDLDVIGNRFIDRRGASAMSYGWSTTGTSTEPVINRFNNRHSGLLVALSQRNEVDSVLPGRGIRTTILAADPTTLADGDIWATTAIDKVRVAGLTKTVTTTPP